MNAHTPFDANQDWSNPYCQNRSNDPMVDALLGNAYHVVRTVYCNLGYIKHLYDFLSKYGVVICVQSEAELKTLTTEAKYVRIYDKSPAGDQRVTDYLYVDDDRTGILPDDTTATGSWVKVASSNSGNNSKDGGYIPWVYNSGSANGGETSIRIPDETAGAPFMIVNGDWQTEGYDFEYDPLTSEIKFTTPLEQGDFVVVMRTGVPATPDNPNVSDWVTINWLYNHGAAVGGEQVIDIPYTFQSVPAVYKNGLRFSKGLSNNSYTIDSDNNRIILTEPLSTNDRLVIQLGGEAKVLETVDRTIQEVARVANVKDSEVILSTDTTQVLNGKKVIYDVVSQRIYVLPTLPTNVYINAVLDGQLTYSPGNITVTLLDSYQQQNTRELWRRSLAEAGLTLVDGSFEEGAVVSNKTDAVWYIAGGQCYYWEGTLPKTIPAYSSPTTTGGVADGAWKAFGDITLEYRLANAGGDKMVGSSFGGTVYSDYARSQFVKFGQFGSISSVPFANHAIYNSSEDLWYVSTATTFPTTVPSSPDSNWRCVGRLNGYPIYDVRNWGLVGDDFTDNTSAFTTMIAKNTGRRVTFYFPSGIYRYTDIGNVKMPRCTFKGDGGMQTVLRCVNPAAGHTALKIDAWPDPVDPNQPHIDGFNMVGIHIEGNSNTATVLDIQGLSRSIWSDVSVWGTQPSSSTGIFLRASSLNNFTNLMCSKYRSLVGQTTNVPVTGIVITTGTRAGVGQGSPSNNLFNNLYMEGVQRGMNMLYGDQNTFNGGSCEANSDYGTNIATGCRYNTFVGMGNENLNATTGDFIDKGTYTKFLNCYSNQRFVAQGKNCVVDGGYFERLEVQASAVSNEIKNLTVNHWNSGSGGLVDNGIGTIKYNIYDSDIHDYINTTAVRLPATLVTTPVSGGTNGVWDNNTRLPVTFYLAGGGTLAQALILRGGSSDDYVDIPLSGTQQVHLESKDRISLTWSTGVTAPTCSYRAKNGYN